MMLGLLFGSPIGGSMGDKFGRKPILIGALVNPSLFPSSPDQTKDLKVYPINMQHLGLGSYCTAYTKRTIGLSSQNLLGVSVPCQESIN